jgi:ubiquinone/menaquinone biosynthesis C-methylase UbiE
LLLVGHKHGLSLRGAASRAALEWRYITLRQWSLEDVGQFWDSVTDYDDVNEGTYSYYRRFTDSLQLAGDLIGPANLTLDIQSRTGFGSVYWAEGGFVRRAHIVDFSARMLSVASARLTEAGVDFEAHLVDSFPLPFGDNTFDLVLCYETIEHIWERATLVHELARVLKPDQWMILTCPNVLWEPAHWLSAILDVHHSEGPHRFLRRSSLLSLFGSSGLQIVREASTVFLPFASSTSVSADRFLERRLPDSIKRFIALRRSFVLRKHEL